MLNKKRPLRSEGMVKAIVKFKEKVTALLYREPVWEVDLLGELFLEYVEIVLPNENLKETFYDINDNSVLAAKNFYKNFLNAEALFVDEEGYYYTDVTLSTIHDAGYSYYVAYLDGSEYESPQGEFILDDDEVVYIHEVVITTEDIDRNVEKYLGK